MSKNEKSAATEKVEKAKKVKDKASKTKSSKGNIFARLGKGAKSFFKDFRGETKKIVWPGAKEVFKSTGVVLVAVLVIGAGIWLADWLLSLGVNGVMDLAEKYGKTATSEAANLFSIL